MSNKELRFEDALARLEAIVEKMENGDSSLEESLALFEEGTALAKQCAAQLNDAELKVVQMMKGADGSPIEMEFKHEE